MRKRAAETPSSSNRYNPPATCSNAEPFVTDGEYDGFGRFTGRNRGNGVTRAEGRVAKSWQPRAKAFQEPASVPRFEEREGAFLWRGRWRR